MAAQDGVSADLAFLAGGGEMGAAIRAHNWSHTPLGPPERWPPTLRTLVAVTLGASRPMFVAWGPDRTLLYNDAYAEVLARKHPAIGRDFLTVWAEIRADLEPLVARAYAGEATHMADIRLVMHRKGYAEETHWDYSYTPLRDDAGAVGGFLCACHEVTAHVMAQRRQAFLLGLEERIRDEGDVRAIMDATVKLLGRHLGAARVGYSEARDDDRTIDFHSCYADGVKPILGSAQLDDFGPASIRRQRHGETEVTADVRTVPDQVQATWDALETRAFVSVPLVRDGRFRASLYVNHRQPHAWTTDELQLIEEVAARTWSAVERARAERALRTSEVRYRSLFEAIDEGFYRVLALFDEAGACVDAKYLDENPAALRITGRSFVGRRLADLGYADPFWCALFGRIARTGAGEHFERFDPDVDRWYDLYAFKPADAAPDELAIVFRDISDQKRSEAALGESEERLRLATDAAEVGFWDVDEVNQRLIWPPRVKAMFGISADMPVSMKDFYGGLHPDDAAATGAAYAAAADPARRALYDVEYRTIGKEDGVVRWVAAKGRGVFDEAGRCLRVVGTAIDVTARRAVDQRLRELNDTLERRVAEQTAERNRVWSMSRDLFAIMGFDGYLKAINPAWARTLGHSEATLLTRSFREQVHPDDHAAVGAIIGRLRAGEAVAGFEDRLRHADGSWRWIAWTLVPEGEVFYAVGRDVTAEREAAAELEAAQEALRQSQKMEAIGQLTGGVAHDFNNLLTPIVGALDMLGRQGLGGAREQRLIAGAAQSAERARTLVQRLLAFARRQPLQPVAVDIAQLVRGMGDLIASTTGPQIKVVVETAEDLPAARADPNQLEMALLNLSVNARDAMPDGGTLRISATAEQVAPQARADLRPGRYVRLSVADTGSGMDEATLARAVEPFFSTKGVGRGTGLGLSMVHGLASQLGGALAIQSRPGLGTNMELWLPQSADRPEADGPEQGAATAGRARGTALLVDDEELVRMSTADMLVDLGWEVIEAASAEEALRLLGKGARCDLLITDHLMPGMNGTDLARTIRAHRPALPALLVSGYAESDGLEAALPRLVKPFRKDELAASIASLIVDA